VPAWCGVELVVVKRAALHVVGHAGVPVRAAGSRHGRHPFAPDDVTAGRTSRPVAEAPWMRHLAAAGVRRVETVPLFERPEVPAYAIVLVGDDPPLGDTAADPEQIALDLVRHRVTAWALGAEIEQVSAALDSNRRIGVAIGVLVTTLRITDDAAFDLLRRASQHRNVKLRDLADDVILTGRLELH
jgi:hypothetical protein